MVYYKDYDGFPIYTFDIERMYGDAEKHGEWTSTIVNENKPNKVVRIVDKVIDNWGDFYRWFIGQAIDNVNRLKEMYDMEAGHQLTKKEYSDRLTKDLQLYGALSLSEALVKERESENGSADSNGAKQ